MVKNIVTNRLSAIKDKITTHFMVVCFRGRVGIHKETDV
jgi:hypothetical protein